MTVECRPINNNEAEAFLSLLCLAFSLDPSHARTVFYNDPIFDLSRKWARFEDSRMTSILTTSALEFGWGRAMGIAGVATHPQLLGCGHATELLEAALAHGEKAGEPAALLFAHRESLYVRAGFTRVDDVLRGRIKVCDFDLSDRPLNRDEVAALYDNWAAESPARLRRSESRWKAWSWSFKACESVGAGYVCIEPLLCREAILEAPLDEWPLAPMTEWFGLGSVTRALHVPLKDARRELLVMARGFPMPPQMFMTDQF